MSEVLAQLEKKGGGGLPDNLDYINVFGLANNWRNGMYVLNGTPHGFSSESINVPSLFARVDTSTGRIVFTQKGTYQINSFKNGVVTAEITEKDVGDSVVFWSAGGTAYSTEVTKLS